MSHFGASGYHLIEAGFNACGPRGKTGGNQMEDRGIITINRERVFTLEEAQNVLPVIRRVTQEYCARVESLMNRLETVNLNQTETITRLEGEVNDLVRAWHEKVKRLGARPKGLWLVDFDAGDGYFCWKYPEPEVAHWHSYSDGFTGRIQVGASALSRGELGAEEI